MGGGTGSNTGLGTRGIICWWIWNGSVAECTIEFITISTLGNAQDFGDLIDGYIQLATASRTRGLFWW